MPTLDFKGKQFVYSHHLGVPFRELRVEPDKSLPAPDRKPSLDDNLIIHGDNLEALKALLPTHAGKVDCIFIDPPYNTGNEGWCYNDNVRSPLMKEWLKRSANPVDKEDLERYDKSLCMMWPQLNLLRDLLAEHGAMVITLDDNEIHRFRCLIDEVFGTENFISTCLWQKDYWWHRIAVGTYGLQGWQRQRVYPDLLACVYGTENGRFRFSILETKGEHLKGNDDTEYKRLLFELLTRHADTAVCAGALELDADPGMQGITFILLMEDSWKQALAAAGFGYRPPSN